MYFHTRKSWTLFKNKHQVLLSRILFFTEYLVQWQGRNQTFQWRAEHFSYTTRNTAKYERFIRPKYVLRRCASKNNDLNSRFYLLSSLDDLFIQCPPTRFNFET